MFVVVQRLHEECGMSAFAHSFQDLMLPLTVMLPLWQRTAALKTPPNDRLSFMISQSVEYALRAVITIANAGGQSCPSREIAEITRVPAPYLSKLMQSLVKSGLLIAQRGPNGGFQLSRAPEEVTLLDVINSLEPLERIEKCPLGIGSHAGTLCPLHRAVDGAIAAAQRILSEVRVSDMVAQPGSVTPLCEDQQLVKLSLGLPPTNAPASDVSPADNDAGSTDPLMGFL